MKRLVNKTEPTPEQIDKWTPDSLIDQLLAVKGKPITKPVPMQEADIKCCIVKLKKILEGEPSLLNVDAPCKIVGDIHGQYPDLLRLLDCGGFPPDTRYLFLGDYVDRGAYGMECMVLLSALKVKFPDKIYLLRGNHECAPISRIYGFYDEVKRRFNVKLWKSFCDMFNLLPLAATIDEKIFCVHAGLSPDLTSMSAINNVKRPIEVPEEGLVCDLLWSDPEPGVTGRHLAAIFKLANDYPQVGLRMTVAEYRPCRFDYDLVVRAHQVVEDGYEFFAQRQMVTIFSAPHYCGEFDNAGAMMSIRDDLMCSFQLLKPSIKKK